MNGDDLRTRIAKVLHERFGPSLGAHPDGWDREPGHSREMYLEDADAVIAELDLGIPCATTGCRMRQIARRHAKASSGLTELPTWGVPSFDNGENR